MQFDLPKPITKLVQARNELQEIWQSKELKFTLDGNLVGDIGEALASDLFGIKLSDANLAGIDGYAPNGWSVQIKATGTGRGPAFRNTAERARQLIFLSFDFENLKGEVVYNGPEDFALRAFPESWTGQKSISMRMIKMANQSVHEKDRLTLENNGFGGIFGGTSNM